MLVHNKKILILTYQKEHRQPRIIIDRLQSTHIYKGKGADKLEMASVDFQQLEIFSTWLAIGSRGKSQRKHKTNFYDNFPLPVLL